MVEEDAAGSEGTSQKSAKKQNAKPKSSPLAHTTNESEGQSNEEEDDEEEEEEKYDIDDSSPEAATTAAATAPAPASTSSGTIKTNSSPPIAPETVAARAINKDGIIESHFTHRSGYDSPDRYRVAQPHPPKVHFRHMIDGVDPSTPMPAPGGGSTGVGRGESVKTPRPGDRNEVHPGAAAASGSDHGGGYEDGQPHSAGVQQHHHHSPHYPHHQQHHHHRDHSKPATAPPDRRAFAVWGQDESDSNTSDGEP